MITMGESMAYEFTSGSAMVTTPAFLALRSRPSPSTSGADTAIIIDVSHNVPRLEILRK